MSVDNERLAKVEQQQRDTNRRVDSHENVIQRVDETLTQLRIYTESSQRLLESHEEGIQQANQREIERERRVDEQFNVMVDKIHQVEMTNATHRSEDRALFEKAINSQNEICQKAISEIVNSRIRPLERANWRTIGIASAVSTMIAVIGLVTPFILRAMG